jgi:hypothetical protein
MHYSSLRFPPLNLSTPTISLALGLDKVLHRQSVLLNGSSTCMESERLFVLKKKPNRKSRFLYCMLHVVTESNQIKIK